MHQSISGLLFHLTALAAPRRRRDDRGDVPGWVMVTLMTAMVIAALTSVFRDQAVAMLDSAFKMARG